MFSKKESQVLSFLIICSGVMVGLAITPYTSFDPVNVPKMAILVVFAFSLSGVLIYRIVAISSSLKKFFPILLILFLIQIIMVFFNSGAPKIQQIYGTFGRNTGLLTYFSLAIIALAAYSVSTPNLVRKIYFALLGTTLISTLYVLLQTTGNDPVIWSNPYNPIVGFLGNPNFQSSFMAMGAVIFYSLLLSKGINLRIKGLSSAIIIILLILMLRSKSQQGLIAFVSGSFLVTYLYFISTKKFANAKFRFTYLGLSVAAVLLGIFGSLKIGPLSFLYKDSVRQRGYYWDAAIQMMKTHKFFGVGLDSYGDWYFATRSSGAAGTSPLVTSNSAHNVFLEFGAIGGFPLLIIYVLLVLGALISIIRYIRDRNEFDYSYAGLIGAWLTFQAQSTISINQIGLAIWGWILMGVIAGYKMKIPQTIENTNSFPKNIRKVDSSMRVIPPMVAGALVSLFIVVPFFSADSNFRTSLTGRDANVFIQASLQYPQDWFRMKEAAIGLSKSGLNSQALSLVDQVLQINPRVHQAWLIKKELTPPSTPGYAEILKKINELNPRVPIK
jgi:O-antigen ligase